VSNPEGMNILNKELLLLCCPFVGVIVGDTGDAIALDEPSTSPGGDPLELAKEEGVKDEGIEPELELAEA
jgi:hypothetical protein